MTLSQHLERHRSSNTNTNGNGNGTSNTNIMNQTSFENSQPVWIKVSIVSQKHPSFSHDDDNDDLSITSSGSRRNFNSRGGNGNGNGMIMMMSKANNRGANGWGWLFGYAIDIDADIDRDSNGQNEDSGTNPNSRNDYDRDCDHMGSNNASSSNATATLKSSPFGQVKLRKTPRSSNMKKEINPILSSSSSSSSLSPSSSPRRPKKSIRNLHQPKKIHIQDEWNKTYNRLSVDLTAEEVSKNVVLANTVSFDASNNGDGTNGGGDGDGDGNDNGIIMVAPKNLIELTHLHEPSLIKSLKQRYDSGKVYTFCGKILLALNPFCEIKDLYSKSTMKQYWNCGNDGGGGGGNDDSATSSSLMEPHAYAIAHEAYVAMKRAFDDSRSVQNTKNGRALGNNDHDLVQIDQSILVSGESGAGKTVTTKIVMQYLASLSEKSNLGNQKKSNANVGAGEGGANGSRSMEQQVLQSNPILESFGNARTIRNDNSSRFGKFIEIQFHKTGCLMGASINTYLLEKVRLIRQAEGERNYHIFYEMLTGIQQRRERRELGLEGLGVNDFRITACSGTFDRRDGVKDQDTYAALGHAMQTIGFSSDEQREILQVTSGLLHMSNMNFMETKADSVIIDQGVPSLKYVLNNFGVNLESLSNALCTCTITVGSEVVKKNLSLDKVEKAMEALMKATYGALFDYIVKSVNKSITVGNQDEAEGSHQMNKSAQDHAFIKILDIFGFESFEKNSFEQLCINYCNEALQQQFNKFIFKLEQQEYEKENIAWSFISFPDNQDVLDLIEKKHTGIFSILDEQCKLAKCTDSSFSHAMYEKCDDHSRFGSTRTQKARGLFAVQHYAGTVEYDTSSFLNKNKDELPKEATDFLLSSSLPTVARLGEILSNKSSGSGSNKKKVSNKKSSLSRASVGNQFTAQLRELRSRIDLTAPHYIRCIKPNDELTPDNFVPAVIADQLNCAGVLEAVRVSRVGYPQRYTKGLFVKRYWMLSIVALEKAKRGRRDVCEELVESIVPQIWAEQQGKNDQSELSQRCTYDLVSVGIQLGKTKVFLRHQAFNALEHLRGQKQRYSATKIQSALRMFLCRSRFERICSSTLIVQCSFRSYQARKTLWFLRESKKAVIIQSAWRGFVDYSTYSYTLFLISWCQRVYRGNVARVKVNEMILDKKASLIQSWWRMETARSRYSAIQLIAFNMQKCYRSKKAQGILRQLKLEAKDVSRISEERDKLKDEITAMKEKEKVWQKAMEENKLLKQNSIQVVKNDQLEKLSNESKEKDKEIMELKNAAIRFKAETQQKAMERSKMYKQKCIQSAPIQIDDELERLRVESRRKDKKIMELEYRIGELQEIIRRNKNSVVSTMRTGAMSSESIASINLLDFDQKLKTPNTKGTELNESWSQESSTLRPKALNFDTPIHTAIRAADDDALSIAITNCEDVSNDINRGGRDGKSPLHLAVLNSNIASAKFLLQNESVANTQDNDGNTPLHYAESGTMTKVLLDVGKANPNIPNQSGICAIHVAVRRRDVESTRLLIEHRANVNVADDLKWLTPLHLVAQSFNFERAGESGSELNSCTIEVAQALLDARDPFTVDVDYQDKDGNTPLHHASVLSSHHAGDLISLFLKKKANPNIQNNRGQTALHLVLHNMNLRKFDFFNDLVQLIVCHGSVTDIPSLSGCTPLHLALYHQDRRNAIQLVENGAQLHHPWEKPTRWQVHWTEHCSDTDVYSLEMIDDEELRLALISSIKSKQTIAPHRSNCMQCKRKIGAFARPKNCQHCGSLVCSSCAPNKLDTSFFPSFCDIKEDEGTICVICEALLISRKRDENIMGREVYAIHGRQEDVSFLDMDAHHHGEGMIPQLQVDM